MSFGYSSNKTTTDSSSRGWSFLSSAGGILRFGGTLCHEPPLRVSLISFEAVEGAGRMTVDFEEALARLSAPECGVCRYEFGPAPCDDDVAYERLGAMFEEAVATFTGHDGPPLVPTPSFSGIDAERAACWRRDRGVVYVLLSWSDNTRYRHLSIGFARRGTVVAGCWGHDAEPGAAPGPAGT